MMTKIEISKTAKQILKAAGVKASVRSGYSSVSVTLLTPCTQEVLDQVRALSTTYGRDIGGGETYYEGTSVAFRFDFPLSEAQLAQFAEIKAKHGITGPRFDYQTQYHFENEVLEKMGEVIGKRALGY